MRNYQPKKNNNYKLDDSLFIRMKYLVKDYPRMKLTAENITDRHLLELSSDNTMKFKKISEECNAIDRALEDLPLEYQKPVFKNVCYDVPYPIDADRTTYGRWKCRFLWNIAKNLYYI